MYEVSQVGPTEFEIVERGHEPVIALARKRQHADMIRDALNQRLMRPVYDAEAAIKSGDVKATDIKEEVARLTHREESEQKRGERMVAELAILDLRTLGFAAEYEEQGGGRCLAVPFPRGWMLLVGTANGDGWGWTTVDEAGETVAGAQIVGGAFTNTRTWQAKRIVDTVRKMHCDAVVRVAVASAEEQLYASLAASFPQAKTGDMRPDALGGTLRTVALQWVRDNVPDSSVILS